MGINWLDERHLKHRAARERANEGSVQDPRVRDGAVAFGVQTSLVAMRKGVVNPVIFFSRCGTASKLNTSLSGARVAKPRADRAQGPEVR
jgi:hypothetical protein